MDETQIKHVIEAALLAAGRPLPLDTLVSLFSRRSVDLDKATLRNALEGLAADYEERGLELKEVASGYRIQIRSSMSEWLVPLWEERAPRYTRALLETLALIAYRQPITRAEIEEVRGVSVSTNIIRTLIERSWIRVVGHRDVPGKPAMYGTTKEFLDYFGLAKLEDLPALADIKDGLPEASPQTDLVDTLDGDGEETVAEDVAAEDAAAEAAEDVAAEDAAAEDAAPEAVAEHESEDATLSADAESPDAESPDAESPDAESPDAESAVAAQEDAMPESAASEHAALEGTELEVVGSGAEEADAEGESSDERAGADAGPAVESNVVTAFGTAGAPEEDREPAGGDDDDRVSETREEAAGQADEAEPDDTDEAGDSSQVGAAGPRIERSG